MMHSEKELIYYAQNAILIKAKGRPHHTGAQRDFYF